MKSKSVPLTFTEPSCMRVIGLDTTKAEDLTAATLGLRAGVTPRRVDHALLRKTLLDHAAIVDEEGIRAASAEPSIATV